MKRIEKEDQEEKERLEFFAAIKRLSDRELYEMQLFVLTQILDATQKVMNEKRR